MITTKPLLQSLTFRVHASVIVAAVLSIVVKATVVLTVLAGFIGSDQVQQLLALLPPKAKDTLDAIGAAVAAAIALLSAVSILIRKFHTTQPITGGAQ